MSLLQKGYPRRFGSRRSRGRAYPERRQPDSIRVALGAGNRMLTYVHTADEPADVARELGLLFDASARERLAAQLRELLQLPVGIDGAIERIYGDYSAGPTDVATAEWKTRAALELALSGPSAERSRARSALERLEQASAIGSLPWRAFIADTRAAAPALDPWFPTIIGTELVEHDQSGATPLLDDGTLEDWQRLSDAQAARIVEIQGGMVPVH